MKISITANIKNIEEEKGNAIVNVKIYKDSPLTNCFVCALYEAILNAMKDTNNDAFYDAMTSFIVKELNYDN